MEMSRRRDGEGHSAWGTLERQLEREEAIISKGKEEEDAVSREGALRGVYSYLNRA